MFWTVHILMFILPSFESSTKSHENRFKDYLPNQHGMVSEKGGNTIVTVSVVTCLKKVYSVQT